jgi:hypothetical protein
MEFTTVKKRELQRGVETMSELNYKDYIIQIRTYPMSGITGKIFRLNESGKRFRLRERTYNFIVISEFVEQLKNYIDKYEINLINKFNTLIS